MAGRKSKEAINPDIRDIRAEWLPFGGGPCSRSSEGISINIGICER